MSGEKRMTGYQVVTGKTIGELVDKVQRETSGYTSLVAVGGMVYADGLYCQTLMNWGEYRHYG